MAQPRRGCIWPLAHAVPLAYLAFAIYAWIDFTRIAHDGLANVGLFLVTLPVTLVILLVGSLLGRSSMMMPERTRLSRRPRALLWARGRGHCAAPVVDRAGDRPAPRMTAIGGRLLANGFSIYLTLVGATLAVAATLLLVKRLRINAGPRAQGQIVGFSRRMKQRPGEPPQLMPLVRFHPRGGAPIEFQSRTSADPGRWPEGTLVPVALRPDQPSSAEIATATRLWLAPLVMMVFSIALLCTAYWAE